MYFCERVECLKMTSDPGMKVSLETRRGRNILLRAGGGGAVKRSSPLLHDEYTIYINI